MFHTFFAGLARLSNALACGAALAVALLGVLSESILQHSGGVMGGVLRAALILGSDPWIRLTVFVILLLGAGIITLRAYCDTVPASIRRARLWLLLTLGWVGVSSFANRQHETLHPSVLIFVGALFCAGIFQFQFDTIVRPAVQPRLALLGASVLVALLSVIGLVPWETQFNFEYRRAPRWSGPWFSPNVAGQLMGVGLILAVGGLIVLRDWSDAHRWRKRALSGLFAGCALLICYRWACSYSRGAWISTACGLGLLLSAYLSARKITSVGPVIRASFYAWKPLVLLGLATGGVTLMLFISIPRLRESETLGIRRVFSAFNPNDWSWRNRIISWHGAVLMIAERPWVGYGWARASRIYGHYFTDDRIRSGRSGETNSYLLIARSVGLPCLAAFLAFVLSCMVRRGSHPGADQTSLPPERSCGPPIDGIGLRNMRYVYPAGAACLLIGAVFNDVLFTAPTAAMLSLLLGGCLLGRGE